MGVKAEENGFCNGGVESEFVGVAEHYLYSIAVDYSGGKGLIDTIYAS